MEILSSKNIIRVGNITLNGRKVNSKRYTKYDKTLGFKWDEDLDENLKTNMLSIVYFIVVNKDIYKIGMTMGKGGIKSCLDFYLSAGTDEPGYNRFTINWLLRKELNNGKEVEVYMMYEEPIKMQVKTLTSYTECSVLIDGKILEHNCKEDYKKIYGNYPKWNYQENGEVINEQISNEFGEYKLNRKNKTS